MQKYINLKALIMQRNHKSTDEEVLFRSAHLWVPLNTVCDLKTEFPYPLLFSPYELNFLFRAAVLAYMSSTYHHKI